MIKLGKYSMGLGDRFGKQGHAQLRAIIEAAGKGVEITPVWNKSNREHNIVHSEPEGTRIEADSAVRNLGWEGPYFVDADHINLSNVDRGSHTLTVQIVREGEVVSQSQSITVHLHRASTQKQTPQKKK